MFWSEYALLIYRNQFCARCVRTGFFFSFILILSDLFIDVV